MEEIRLEVIDAEGRHASEWRCCPWVGWDDFVEIFQLKGLP